MRRTRTRGGALGARAAKLAILLLADAQRLLKVLANCTTTDFTAYRAPCQQKLALLFLADEQRLFTGTEKLVVK